MQCVRGQYPALSCSNLMQLFMWQRDDVVVAHYIMDRHGVLGVLDDAPDDASTSLLQPWRLDRCNPFG